VVAFGGSETWYGAGNFFDRDVSAGKRWESLDFRQTILREAIKALSEMSVARLVA
jgi:hypothetical protein